MTDDEALLDAIKHADEVAYRNCGTECGDQHRQLARWLTELRSLRSMPNRDGFVRAAMGYAAEGDPEGFDLFADLLPERDRFIVQALAEGVIFEEWRQRLKSSRTFPFDQWHPRVQEMLIELMGEPGGSGDVTSE